MLTNKCCGTCKFWDDTFGKPVGDCLAPIPEAVYDYYKSFMLASEGKFCKAWQQKEEEDKKK